MIINKFVKKKKQQQHGKNCDVEWANMSTDKNIEHKPVSTGKKRLKFNKMNKRR